MRAFFMAGVFLLVAGLLSISNAQSDSGAATKIRTITAFIRLDRQSYRPQIEKTLTFLHSARAELIKAGYEVETIRITTQPFPEYTQGMTPEQVLAFFHEYDALAQKENFAPDIGPALVKDSDDAGQARSSGADHCLDQHHR